MNKEDKENLGKIRDLIGSFNFKFGSSMVKLQFLDVTTEDGTILTIGDPGEEGELAVGQMVTIKDPITGEVFITANAEHTLDDGTVIKTDAESRISEILPSGSEEESETETETEMSDETTDVIVDTEPKVENKEENSDEVEENDYDSRISSLEEMIKELIANQKSIADATNSAYKSISEEISKFASAPAVDIDIDLSSTSSEKEDKDIRSPKEKAMDAIKKFNSQSKNKNK